MLHKIKKIGLVAIVAVSVAIFALTAFTSPDQKLFEVAKHLDIFATMYRDVNLYYVDEINPSQFMRTGIEGMLRSLDPYTNYIPEEDIEDFRTMTTGQYGGIGAAIGNREKKIIITMPYEGYPAFKAGLRIGDAIEEIDGIKTENKNVNDISKLLKGQAGTKVTLKVVREGGDKALTIDLIREKIKIDNVPYYGMVTNDVGYLSLTDFTSGSSVDVQKALNELKKQGAQKIIFDLRDNPGGLLNEAVNIANLFLPKGLEIVSTKGRIEEWNKSYKSLNQPFDTRIPLVCLTNSRSASASEIVSGSLQDYDRSVIVGQRTFGKGLVQATRPLSYNSQLKITTAKYLLPSGRCIQEIDYSKRDAAGKAVKRPDSLADVFKTMAGRPVRDGHGVMPDISVDEPDYAPITEALITKNLIFDYATWYANQKSSIAEAKSFKLTDDEYKAFVTWLKGKDYDYTTQVEKTLESLKDVSKKEKYFEEIEKGIEELGKLIAHNKENDLVKFRPEIQELLEQEIVSRYYLTKGIREASFDSDPDVQAALKVLNNPAEYEKILKGG